MSLRPVSLRVKKQEKYLARILAPKTHFDVQEVQGLFHMYRQAGFGIRSEDKNIKDCSGQMKCQTLWRDFL